MHFADSVARLIQSLHQEFPKAHLVPAPEHGQSDWDLWIDALGGYRWGVERKQHLLHLETKASQ